MTDADYADDLALTVNTVTKKKFCRIASRKHQETMTSSWTEIIIELLYFKQNEDFSSLRDESLKTVVNFTYPEIDVNTSIGKISSSSSYRAGSTDIPDPLSPLLPIVHRSR